MSVQPAEDRVAVFLQVREQLVHGLALLLGIPEEAGVHHRPGLQSLLGGELAEGRGGVRHHRVDDDFVRECVYLLRAEHRGLVGPPDGGFRMAVLPPPGVFFLAVHPVDAHGAAYAKDILAAGFDHSVIRYTPPPRVRNALLGKTSRVVVVPADERYPVVRLAEPAGHRVVDSLIVSGLLEPESAVPGDDAEGVRVPVLNTQLVHEGSEVPVDVAGDDDLFGFGIGEEAHLKLKILDLAEVKQAVSKLLDGVHVGLLPAIFLHGDELLHRPALPGKLPAFIIQDDRILRRGDPDLGVLFEIVNLVDVLPYLVDDMIYQNSPIM